MTRLAFAAAAVVIVVGTGTYANDEDSSEKGGEVKLQLADCPAAVQKTFEREAQGAKIEEVEKENEDGKTVYEADVQIHGNEYEVAVAEDGTLLEKKLDAKQAEDEGVEVKFAECPSAVQKTLRKEAGGAEIDVVDKESKKGRTIYEADVTIDGKKYEIAVAEDGLLASKKLNESNDDEDPDDEDKDDQDKDDQDQDDQDRDDEDNDDQDRDDK